MKKGQAQQGTTQLSASTKTIEGHIGYASLPTLDNVHLEQGKNYMLEMGLSLSCLVDISFNPSCLCSWTTVYIVQICVSRCSFGSMWLPGGGMLGFPKLIH